MKIIVAGGTGFLGKKIVSSLADKGHNVCVLTRNLQKHKNTFSNNVNVIDWSTINPSQLSDTNILIKLNGEKVDQLWTKSVKSKILNSRIDSTRMLFDFCVKNEIIPQKFINASAVGIYAKESANYNFSVDENSKLGNTFLARVCVENEKNSDIFKVFEDIDIIQLRIGVVLQKKIINLWNTYGKAEVLKQKSAPIDPPFLHQTVDQSEHFFFLGPLATCMCIVM